jgi:Enoyl-(Acyl carrier protein) reductase
MSSSPGALPTGSSKPRPKSARNAPRPSTPATALPWRASSATCPHRSTTCWSRPAARATGLCSQWTQPRCARRLATTSCWDSRSRVNASGKMRPGGTLLLMGGTGGRRIGHGLGIAAAATAALPAFTAALALELAPVRVNLIAAGFVDTPLSASLLGDRLEERRQELRATLPIASSARPSARSPSTSDQHGAHRRDIRHRRRTAVRLLVNTQHWGRPSQKEAERYVPPSGRLHGTSGRLQGTGPRRGNKLLGLPVPSVEERAVTRGPSLAEPRRAQIPVGADLDLAIPGKQ